MRVAKLEPNMTITIQATKDHVIISKSREEGVNTDLSTWDNHFKWPSKKDQPPKAICLKDYQMTLIIMSGSMNQFDVYIVELDPSRGAEKRKTRPAVIISPKEMNKNLETVLIAPLTHTLKRYPSRVFCEFNKEIGEVVLDQIRGIDKKRLKRKIGKIDKRTASNVKKVLCTMFP